MKQIILMSLTLLCSVGWAATYYVAPNGSNSGNGSSSSPWQTIGYGISKCTAGDVLKVRGGVYRELVNVAVNGTAGSPIVIENYPGERPIVDGSKAITGWKRCTAADPGLTVGGKVNPNYNKIWRADIPKQDLKTVYQGYLFEKGRFLSPACDPDQSDADIIKVHEGAPVPDEGGNIGNKAFLTDTKRFTQGAGDYWKGAFFRIHMKNLTSRTITRIIAGYDPAAHKITFTTPLDAGLHGEDRYYIYNHPHTLNKAGEYYYTTTPVNDKYTVYLWPRSEASLASGISMALRTYGFSLDSRTGVTIRGFEIRNTLHGGVYAGAGQDITVSDCRVHSLMGSGIYAKDCTRFRSEDCHFLYIKSEDTEWIIKGMGIWAVGGTHNALVRDTVWQSEHSAIYYGGQAYSIIDGCLVKPWAGGVHNNGISVYVNCHHVLVANTRAIYLRFNTVRDIFVYNNIFPQGIQSWGGMTGTTTILNNVILGDFHGHSLWGGMGEQVLYNNIIYNKIQVPGTQNGHNIYINPLASQNKPHDQAVAGAISTVFADFAGGDYHLKPGCTAIDSGKDISGLLPKTAFPEFPFDRDFDGNPRVQGTAIDIGPYEWSGAGLRKKDPRSGSLDGPGAWPNPMRDSVLFGSRGAHTGVRQAHIYSENGTRVAHLSAGPGIPLVWNGRGTDGRPAAAGFYFYTLCSGRDRTRGSFFKVPE